MQWKIKKLLGKNPYAAPVNKDHWSAEELINGGYRLVFNPFLGSYPDGFNRDAEYLFIRTNWSEPERFRMADMPPWFNLCGLYYRPIV